MLERLADAEDVAIWAEFDARYRPIVASVLRRLGFTQDDAQDLTQETLLQVVRDYRAGRYDRKRGSLRAWLSTIARNRAADLHRKRGLLDERRGDSILSLLPDASAFETAFENESREHVLCTALDMLRRSSEFKSETLCAFERFALAGESVDSVAADLGLTTGAVYMAKHHCLVRLRELSDELRVAFELE